MKLPRRNFLHLAAGAAALAAVSRIAKAQAYPSRPGAGRLPLVAVLMPYAESDSTAQVWYNAFVRGMQALGWTEGRNFRMDVRWAGGEVDRIQALARKLVDLKPDAIFTVTTPSVNAARRETRTIPIVFTQVTDPVAQGIVESLARPGGNITGITIFEPEIGGKWVHVLKEMAPGTTRVAVIFNPDTAPYYRLYMRAVEAAAASLTMKAIEAPAHNPAEIEAAISLLAREPAGGLIAMSDGFTVVHSDLIVALAARYRLPAAYSFRFQVTKGGLISYGVDLIDMQWRAATFVDRILKGAKPSDLPVELPTKFELVISLKTAKALGLDVPPSVLARADEVIE